MIKVNVAKQTNYPVSSPKIKKALRVFLKDKGIVDKKTYRNLYLKSKGGFFRSKSHIKLYINEHKLGKKQ